MLETTPSVGGAQLTRNQRWAACSPVCPACPHAGIVSRASPSANASARVVTATTVLSASVMADLPFEVRSRPQLICDWPEFHGRLLRRPFRTAGDDADGFLARTRNSALHSTQGATGVREAALHRRRGHAAADGPSDAWGVREVGTVRFIDRDLNLIQLEDGTELHTTDARILRNIREGMRVQVDFIHGGDKNELNSLAPVGSDAQVDVSPTAGGSDLHSTPDRLVGGPSPLRAGAGGTS